MKTNWRTHIVGQNVHLVPYKRKYVENYHEWMKDPYILDMTASEPLTLEEEYSMQQSWKDDEKTMAGDVNLFFNDYEDSSVAEIECMIAREDSHRKGLAKEALKLIMAYGIQTLGVSRFYCKIHESNEPSLRLFKSLGYVQCNYVAAFKEFELELRVSEEYQQRGKKLFETRYGKSSVGSVDEEEIHKVVTHPTHNVSAPATDRAHTSTESSRDIDHDHDASATKNANDSTGSAKSSTDNERQKAFDGLCGACLTALAGAEVWESDGED